MAFRIVLSSLFNIDLEKLVSYYFELNPSTAKKNYKGIIALIKKLEKFPKFGRIVPECEDVFYDKYRELIYENFRIIYRIEINQVFVLRIFDARMDLDIGILDSRFGDSIRNS